MTRGRVIWLLIAGYLSAVFLGFWGTVLLLIVVAVVWELRDLYREHYDDSLADARARAREAEEKERLVTDAASEYADRLETTPFSISGAHKRLREALRRDGGQ